MKAPLVSVIVPCYNQAKYIPQLLDSVLGQSYDQIELIAVNDGATDNTLEVLESYKEKFKEKGFKYKIISQKNGGLPNAINAGLKVFNGKYLNFIDCDDSFTKDSIEKRVNHLEHNKSLDVVWSASAIVDASSEEVTDIWRDVHSPARKNLFMDFLTQRDYIWVSASRMVRASTFLSVYPERQIQDKIGGSVYQGQNIQIFLPIYFRGNNVGYLDEVLVNITAHNASESRKKRNEQELRSYHLRIRNMFIDTLYKMKMSDEERDKYIEIVQNIYKPKITKVFRIKSNDKDDLARMYEYDEQKYRAGYSENISIANQPQLAARLIFSSHSLEKSLSNENFEIGHGFRTARLLVDILRIYDGKGFDKSHLAFINTISVLHAFFERHEGTGYEREIAAIFSEFLLEIKNCTSKIGGANSISSKEKESNDKKNFKELAEGRFAVRTYSDEEVDKADIKEAIEIAMKTPTVCNRQSIRVRAFYKKNIIEEVLKVQGGLEYYETPPALLLITADDSGYVGVNERNQGFIDGGLFAMSVLYALEYKKLAACPAHAMFTETSEMTIRGMLNLSDSEKLITFITVGHFKEDNKVCKSFRYPAEQILSEIDEIYEYAIEAEVEQPHEAESVNQSLRYKIRPRTRIKVVFRRIKHVTRIRTRLRNLLTRLADYLDARKYDKADGAILTLTGYFNYGNVMQRYALQKFLKNNGHNFVSYVDPFLAPRATYPIGRRIKLKTPFRAAKRFLTQKRPYWYVPGYGDLYPQDSQLENMIEFVNSKIWVKPFDKDDSYKNYIVGSDQVWRNWWDNSETLGYYFLNFLNEKKARRVAYAVSLGMDDINKAMSKEDINYLLPYIQRFDSIAVREGSAVGMIEKTWHIKGVDKVVDPTLLLTKTDYSSLIEDSKVKNDKVHPIFTYIIGETPEIRGILNKIQLHKNQLITKIRVHGHTIDETLPPPEFWLKGFRDAELVVTNSFHGMMLSVINNTEFIVIGREEGGLARIKEFLSEYGIEDRFVHETEITDFNMAKLTPIDWDGVNYKLDKTRHKSSDWLLSSIEKK